MIQLTSVLPWDARSAELFSDLRRQSVRIGSMDLRIACIALAHDAILLTRNSGDFARVPGLRIENWLDWACNPSAQGKGSVDSHAAAQFLGAFPGAHGGWCVHNLAAMGRTLSKWLSQCSKTSLLFTAQATTTMSGVDAVTPFSRQRRASIRALAQTCSSTA